MKRLLTVPLALLFWTGASPAEEGYWQQYVHYKMDIRLIPDERALRGEETIIYHNNSPDTLHHFYLHLYPNAYRGSQSVYAREAREFYVEVISDPEAAGYIKIESLVARYGPAERSYAVPMPFRVDDTILEADLPQPLPPGERVQVELTFYHKVREHRRRAGYRDHQYDFAQWYPKVCVYDQSGWNAEPFHYIGEFYGEFGTFDVTLHVPFEYIVAATGLVTAGDPGWEAVRVDTSLSDAAWRKAYEEKRHKLRQQAGNGKTRTVTFHAEHVHDFAWVASPEFVYESGAWDGIPIHVLYRAAVKKAWSRVVVQRAARALAWLSEKFGRYPYPQVTVTHGLLGGGMEYPMLVMNGSEREGLILHEIGHIYFYGILANNEWKEAWLDEGFTTFQTRWYMEERYGPAGYDLQRLFRDATFLQRHRPQKTRRERRRDAALDFMTSRYNEPISKYAYRFHEPESYGVNTYTKGGFFYDMLKYVVGDSAFGAICKEYFRRWAFKHVNEQRLKQVCEEVSGKDLDWFFDQWLHQAVPIDYGLGEVTKEARENGWHTRVQIHRHEAGVMPVQVELTLEDNTTVQKRWDGRDRSGSLSFTTERKPVRVVLDPDDAILDNTRWNNGPIGLTWLFDYPSLSYAPRDAYLITWRPSGWHNEVDEARIGGRLRGGYRGTRLTELGIWLGVASEQLDARFRYANRVRPLGSETMGHLMVQKMEGRFEADAHLSFAHGPYYALPPKHRLTAGFNVSRLLDESYALRDLDQKRDTTVVTWEKGDVHRLYATYDVSPRGLHWFSHLAFGFETAQESWGSDFTFTKLSAELKLWLPDNHEGLFLRFFGGKIIDSEEAPTQDLLFLEGANPRQRFERFYLRSHGALPEELHYHLPGGGNLRGYYNNPRFGDELLALNGELRKRVRLKLFRRGPLAALSRPTLVGFAEVASLKYLESETRLFADAGVGVRIHTRLPDAWYTMFTGGRELTLRFDFPLWVSDPLPDENSVRFRWVFGFEQPF